jgi:hypothetical protein
LPLHCVEDAIPPLPAVVDTLGTGSFVPPPLPGGFTEVTLPPSVSILPPQASPSAMGAATLTMKGTLKCAIREQRRCGNRLLMRLWHH